MMPIRLGAVGYLNARPLVYGLERLSRFLVRYDVPSECARLLHDGETDVGLIPSIEYLRGPRGYDIVPDLAIASRGPVASVALYTRREPRDIRTIAMDASSRTSVALVFVLAAREFGVASPEPIVMKPDCEAMLAKGIYVIGFSYPVVPQDKARIRAQISAVHSRADLLKAIRAFAEVKQELGL